MDKSNSYLPQNWQSQSGSTSAW